MFGRNDAKARPARAAKTEATPRNGHEPAAAPSTTLLTIVGQQSRVEGKFEIADSIQIECEVGGELTVGGKLVGGGNMVAMHLAKAVGGNMMLGFLAAVAFATILAVVSGLALAGASAISHDLYARVIKKGKASEESEIRVSKIATIVLGIVAIVLGILFEKQNVAFMVGLAFGVAAAANFPVLILSMYWKGLTTRGALAGGYGGLLSAVSFVVLSKSVWVNVDAQIPPYYPR